MVTKSGGAATPRASVRRSVNVDSSRSSIGKRPLECPYHIAAAHNPVQTSATRIGRRRFVIVIVRASLSKSCHQRRDACRRPALDDQFAGRFDIDTITWAERDVAAAGAARDAYASLGDK